MEPSLFYKLIVLSKAGWRFHMNEMLGCYDPDPNTQQVTFKPDYGIQFSM
jgi:hypothetical protein